eukprot:10136722-Lingulodinium_polyedra.AAC.1
MAGFGTQVRNCRQFCLTGFLNGRENWWGVQIFGPTTAGLLQCSGDGQAMAGPGNGRAMVGQWSGD